MFFVVGFFPPIFLFAFRITARVMQRIFFIKSSQRFSLDFITSKFNLFVYVLHIRSFSVRVNIYLLLSVARICLLLLSYLLKVDV